MELMDQTLDQLLDQTGRLSEMQAYAIFKRIVQGVQYCHSQGIIHRDLKLENVLVRFEADDETLADVKLADFGHSLNITENHVTTPDLRGTVEYTAPELFSLGSSFDAKIDSWSLGIILFALLFDRTPFQSSNSRSMIQRI